MRGKNADYELLQQEINKLKNTVGDANSEKSNEKSFDWSELVNAPGKKAMIIGIVLALLNQLCGKKDLNRQEFKIMNIMSTSHTCRLLCYAAIHCKYFRRGWF